MCVCVCLCVSVCVCVCVTKGGDGYFKRSQLCEYLTL